MLPLAIRRHPTWGDPAGLAHRALARLLGEAWDDDAGALVRGPLAAYPVDITEDENSVKVEAELPGFKRDEVNVTMTDGTLWTWGYNGNGQLGDNTLTNSNIPVQEYTLSDDWTKVSSGSQHSAAIKSNGTLWTWGYNNSGQLGDGTSTDRLTPVQEATGTADWVAVAAGSIHTMALKSNGTLWTWGNNSWGQLGDGTTTPRLTPVQEATVATDWNAIAVGTYHTVARKADGTLWSWGQNEFGQLGDGTITGRLTPVQEATEATDWAAVAAGSNHTVALKADGTLWAWGQNF